VAHCYRLYLPNGENRKRRKGGGKAIQLYTKEEGEPMATASVWVQGLEDGEIAIKDYSENAGILDELLSKEIVTVPHRYMSTGFALLPVVRLHESVLSELEPKLEKA
jgi:hypothetical protein